MRHKVKSRLEKSILLVLEMNRFEKKPHHVCCLKKEKNLSPCHKYLCKWNLRASNEKRQKLSQSEQIVFKSFGSHEFHDRVLRLKTEVTADFFMGISENLWNANEFLDNWKNEILIFILKTQKEEKPPETLNQSI